MSFVVSDSLLETTRRQAINVATQNAFGQLSSAVSALNSFASSGAASTELQFLELHITNQGSSPPPIPYPVAGVSDSLAGSEASAPLPIVGGSTSITASVDAKVRI